MTKTLLDDVTQIAKAAANRILDFYNPHGFQGARMKRDQTPVTEADIEADRIIIQGLSALTPDIPVISEEMEPGDYSLRQEWKSFWLVDPLDGTSEFVEGRDEFTVNIALVEDGVPILGVIVAPARALEYKAHRDLGSWRCSQGGDWNRIYSTPFDTRKPAVVVESRSHGSPEQEAYLSRISISKRIALASSLKFCLLAEGTANLYPRFTPSKEWDVAAGDAIYRYSSRAKPNPSPLTYNKPDLENGFFVVGSILLP